MNQIPVTILTGLLGSGRTTFRKTSLSRVLRPVSQILISKQRVFYPVENNT